MKRTTTLRMVGVLGFALLAACKPDSAKTPAATPGPVPAWGNQNAAQPAPGGPGAPAGGILGTGPVLETMNSGGYTYVLVDMAEKGKIWAAAPQFDVKVGDKVSVPQGAPMKDFKSGTLNRTFDMVYFVGAISKGDAPVAAAAPAPSPAGAPLAAPGGTGADIAAPHGNAPNPAAAKMDFTGLKPAAGGKRVEQIFGAQAELGGKEVSVRGKVVKYNAGVMGKNWLHVQDGTGKPGQNDLTVTTDGTAKVGDTVLVKGPVSLNKDFGFGYKYDVIVENAAVTVEP